VLGPGFGGSLQAEGTAEGSWTQPSVRFRLAASALRLGDAVRLATARGQGVIDTRPGGSFDARLEAGGLQLSGVRVGRIEATTGGSAEAHLLRVTASAPGWSVTLDARGGLEGAARWRGSINRLDLTGPWPARLLAPAGLLLARDRVEVRAARLQSGPTTLALASLDWSPGTLASQGTASGVILPELLLARLRDAGRPLDSDLRLAASWDLRLGEGADAADGTLTLRRESGDLRLGDRPTLALGLTALELRARLMAARLEISGDVQGSRFGSARFTAGTRLARRPERSPGGLPGSTSGGSAGGTSGGTSDSTSGSTTDSSSGALPAWTIDPTAPARLQASLGLPDLRWLGPLLGVTGLTLDGRLDATLDANGSLAQPVLRGTVSGTALRLAWPEQGIDYRNGSLTARFDQDRLELDSLRIPSGAGSAEISGNVRLAEALPSGRLAVKLTRFLLIDRPDRQAVASGTGSFAVAAGRMRLDADLTLERGRLSLGANDTVVRSSDVVIVRNGQGGQGAQGAQGGQGGAERESPAAATPLDLAVTVDFGPAFQLRGAGVEGRLAGRLRVLGEAGGTLRAVGTLNIVDGVYRAYGQDLALTRANLNFSGPMTNPGLDFLAIRRNLPVEVGVAVRGSAEAPLAELVSTPELSDTEKLSWLIFGHGLSGSREGEIAALTAAAASLIGGAGGPGLTSRLAAALGVDELRLAAGQDGGGIVTLGKRLSSALYVSFERSLSTLGNVLKVRYELSRRWAVELRTGTENAIDVLFGLRFD